MHIGAGPAFGRFATVCLENDLVRLVVCPEVGGRVVSMLDRRTGREWLVQGEPPDAIEPWAAPDATFSGRQSFGWDECLPTIGVCPDPLDPDGPPLRDHGDQWGRSAEVTLDGNVLVTTWDGVRWPYLFRRRLRLDGGEVVAEYALEHRGGTPFPYLWSMHAELELEPGSKIWAYWPERGEIAWDVKPITAHTASKSFIRLRDDGYADVNAAPEGSVLRFSWDQGHAPILGLWQDYGGWPPDDPVHQVALEPTTAATDLLDEAIATDQAVILSPGEVHTWWVRMRVALGGSS